MSIKLFKYMNGNRMRIPKSWILLATFIVSVVGAGAWIYTIPPNGLTNQTGIWFGNNSLDGKNVTGDKVDVFGEFGTVIGSYVDSYSCSASYCIYQPHYAPTYTYAKNTTSGIVEYSGTDAGIVAMNAINSGKSVMFGEGTFIISTKLNTSNGQTISGIKNKTVIQRSGSIPVVFNISQDSHVVLKDLYIDASETSAVPGHHAILISNSSIVDISNIEVRNCGKECMWVQFSDNFTIDNFRGYSYSKSVTYDGMDLMAVNDFKIINSYFESGDDSIALNSATNGLLNNIQSVGCFGGALLKIRAASSTALGDTRHIIANNLQERDCAYGINIWNDQSTYKIIDVSISNFNFFNNSMDGILLNTTSSTNYYTYDIKISHGHIENTTAALEAYGTILDQLSVSNVYVLNQTMGFNLQSVVNAEFTDNDFNIIRPDNAAYWLLNTPGTVHIQGGNIMNSQRGIYMNSANLNIFATDVVFTNVVLPTSVATAPNVMAVYNNYGIAPFHFGSKSTAPTAFGEGDSYYNTSALSHQQCWYKGATLSWRNATNVTTGCST